MRKILISCALASMTVTAVPVSADPPPWAPAHGRRAKAMYDSRGYYLEPRPLTRSDRIWEGDDGKYHCRRENGTTGLVIGAAVGGIAGHELAGRGDKAIGTLIGAAGGAILGRAIDRGDLTCR